MVSNCSVLNKTFTSLSIKCNPGFDGGSRQQFIAEVYDASTGAKMLNLTSEDAEFFVSGLEHDLTYDIRIYAFNSKGRSMKIEFKETLIQERHKNLGMFAFSLVLNNYRNRVLNNYSLVCLCSREICSYIRFISFADHTNGYCWCIDSNNLLYRYIYEIAR